MLGLLNLFHIWGDQPIALSSSFFSSCSTNMLKRKATDPVGVNDGFNRMPNVLVSIVCRSLRSAEIVRLYRVSLHWNTATKHPASWIGSSYAPERGYSICAKKIKSTPHVQMILEYVAFKNKSVVAALAVCTQLRELMIYITAGLNADFVAAIFHCKQLVVLVVDSYDSFYGSDLVALLPPTRFTTLKRLGFFGTCDANELTDLIPVNSILTALQFPSQQLTLSAAFIEKLAARCPLLVSVPNTLQTGPDLSVCPVFCSVLRFQCVTTVSLLINAALATLKIQDLPSLLLIPTLTSVTLSIVQHKGVDIPHRITYMEPFFDGIPPGFSRAFRWVDGIRQLVDSRLTRLSLGDVYDASKCALFIGCGCQTWLGPICNTFCHGNYYTPPCVNSKIRFLSITSPIHPVAHVTFSRKHSWYCATNTAALYFPCVSFYQALLGSLPSLKTFQRLPNGDEEAPLCSLCERCPAQNKLARECPTIDMNDYARHACLD